MILGDFLINREDKVLFLFVKEEQKKVVLKCLTPAVGYKVGSILAFDRRILNYLQLATPEELQEYGLNVTIH